VSSKTKEGEKGKEKRVATEYKERKTHMRVLVDD
jgi:hypothetical protein